MKNLEDSTTVAQLILLTLAPENDLKKSDPLRYNARPLMRPKIVLSKVVPLDICGQSPLFAIYKSF
jgi:hypothetical protein